MSVLSAVQDGALVQTTALSALWGPTASPGAPTALTALEEPFQSE